MKKAILVVSFGSSIQRARERSIEPIEQLMRSTFNEYEVRRAFSSQRIIDKLKKEQSIIVHTPIEALDALIQENYEEIIVQPLHIIPGYEYEKIQEAVNKYQASNIRISLGRPLLYYKEDYEEVIVALSYQLPEIDRDEIVLFMGHGTRHFSNACYYWLQSELNDRELPVIVGTVEEGIDKVIPTLKKNKISKVNLIPFMLVAGDHALNDMAGNYEDSWKCTLENHGFLVTTVLEGLGENEAIRNIYLEHVQDCI